MELSSVPRFFVGSDFTIVVGAPYPNLWRLTFQSYSCYEPPLYQPSSKWVGLTRPIAVCLEFPRAKDMIPQSACESVVIKRHGDLTNNDYADILDFATTTTAATTTTTTCLDFNQDTWDLSLQSNSGCGMMWPNIRDPYILPKVSQ